MNLTDIHKKLNTEKRCYAYLEKLRWGKKPTCVFCGSEKVYKRKNSIRWHCNHCNRDYSVKENTIFEGTRLPLVKWFQLIVFMLSAKQGVSSSVLSRALGISYKTV